MLYSTSQPAINTHQFLGFHPIQSFILEFFSQLCYELGRDETSGSRKFCSELGLEILEDFTRTNISFAILLDKMRMRADLSQAQEEDKNLMIIPATHI